MYVPIYNDGIVYAKIAKKDNDGRDNTPSLEALTSFKINYDDVGLITYNVLEIREFNTYFLFKLIPVITTSSTDINVLDFKLNVQNTSSVGYLTQDVQEFPEPPSRYINFSVENNDSLNSFNSPFYIFPSTTPNLILSFSINDTSNLGDGVFYYLYSNLRDILFITQSNGGTQFTYTGSFFTDERIAISYTALNIFSSSAPNYGTLTITQSISPTSSLNQVIFIPYLFENFYNSDNNVLINNVSTNRDNNRLMRVDYPGDIIIPVNREQILSGTADRADIPEYYYNLKRHTLPRYEGSKLQTAYINNYYGRQSDFVFINRDSNNYEGDIGFGNITNIRVLNTEIFEFDWAHITRIFPECSQVKLGNIIEVTSASRLSADATIISNKNNFEAYEFIISSSFRPDNDINLNQYTTDAVINNLNVVTTNFGVPTTPEYWIPTNITSSIGSGDYLSKWNSTYQAFEVGFMRKADYDYNNDRLEASSLNEPIYLSFNELTSSIEQGEQWFMTVSDKIDSPLNTNIIPWNYGYTDGTEKYGVYKIISASGPTPQLLFFNRPLLTTSSTTWGVNKDFGSGSGKLGMFLWKPLINKDKYIVVNSFIYAVGKGYILLPNSSDSINNNYNYILKTYGNKN